MPKYAIKCIIIFESMNNQPRPGREKSRGRTCTPDMYIGKWERTRINIR